MSWLAQVGGYGGYGEVDDTQPVALVPEEPKKLLEIPEKFTICIPKGDILLKGTQPGKEPYFPYWVFWFENLAEREKRGILELTRGYAKPGGVLRVMSVIGDKCRILKMDYDTISFLAKHKVDGFKTFERRADVTWLNQEAFMAIDEDRTIMRYSHYVWDKKIVEALCELGIDGYTADKAGTTGADDFHGEVALCSMDNIFVRRDLPFYAFGEKPRVPAEIGLDFHYESYQRMGYEAGWALRSDL